ncbi:hypothetical protein JCM33374_g390 [Metschnikowia sp. JCM 33374]|nr:hypothetical protein JCM33374_g390 [Metschnikowia sp. JCM 33374]
MRSTSSWISALVGVLVFTLTRTCLAEGFNPDVKMTSWDKPAEQISYFEGSSNVLVLFDDSGAVSTDNGETWKVIDQFKGHIPVLMEMDPNFPERAFVFSEDSVHFVTNDRGNTWQKFEVSAGKGKPVSTWDIVYVNFNSAQKDYVILTMKHCSAHMPTCGTEVFYTNDGFKTNPKPIGIQPHACIFARENTEFDPSAKPETMFCILNKSNSFGHVVESTLVKSTNFFRDLELIDHEFFKSGEIIDIRVQSAFFVAVLKKEKFTDASISLVVSKDATNFQNSDIDFEITYGAVMFLKSTPSSLRLALIYQGRHTREEVIYFSDSTGLKFSKIAQVGLLSSSTSANVDGVWFADIKASDDANDFATRYSLDDGKTWDPLAILDDDKCKVSDGCSFNFIPESRFASRNTFQKTPDILLASGVKGKSYDHLSDVDTYVSRDGGATWKFALQGRSMVSYVDQGNVLVAFPVAHRDAMSNKLHFSLDQGNSWSTYELAESILPIGLETVSDLSSTKTVILGRKGSKSIAFSVDFKDAFGGKSCGNDDFEDVNARFSAEVDGPTCILGHKATFSRRKQDAQCLVKSSSGAVKITTQPCECTVADFECSPYFKLSEKGACVPNHEEISKLCQSSKQKNVKIEKETGDHSDNAISIKLSKFDGTFDQYSYVESSNLSSNILVHTDKDIVHASNDGGVSFVQVPVDDDILFFLVGPVDETAILVSLKHFRAIIFDPTDSKKFLFIAADQMDKDNTPYYTEDAGASFKKLPFSSNSCDYVASSVGSQENLMYCVVSNNGKKKLVSSTDYFQTSQVLFENVLAIAVKPDFVLVATITDENTLELKVTSDGSTFADADFPNDFSVEAQSTYTILESHRHSVFLHLTTDKSPGRELGAILKSNSNGTSYVLSLDHVNRDHRGYVDYDRIDNLEGVIIANTVTNPTSKDAKTLKTQISYNDGSQWSYLSPPAVDSEGKKYSCIGSSLAKCSLNLHGFTERPDYRDTFSSSSAIGFLIGVGNVGESLKPYKESSTFISADGGVTWKEVSKGVFMWEYGDRGTILLLVNAVDATDEFLFSTDDGNTWQKHKFADKPVFVRDLATVPTDTARKFVIFAHDDTESLTTFVYSLDFTNFYKRQCRLDLDHPLEDDFEYWTPRHPESADDCLFGHVSNYLRRAQGHYDCFIGAVPLIKGMKTVKDCPCSRRDYECDYNYYRAPDGTCKLVEGLTPQDRKAQICSKPNIFQYFEPTGYRKIPISTCVGGNSFDSWHIRPCPGHEEEFNRAYGRNLTFGKFLVILLVVIGVFSGATWFVYQRGIKRNGGFSRLGQIRLDDEDGFNPIEENTADVVVNKVVKGGIVVVAGIIAVVKTVRKIDRKLLENATRIVFRRRPGRREYVRVPDDEDELFGDFEDYDDELGDTTDVNFDVEDEPDQFEEFASNEPEQADARLFDIDDEETQPASEESENEETQNSSEVSETPKP